MKSLLCALVLVAILFAATTEAKWTTYCAEPGTCPSTITDITPYKTENGEYSACIVGSWARQPTGILCAHNPDVSDFELLNHHEPSFMFVALSASADMKTVVSIGASMGNTTHLMYTNDFTDAYNSKGISGAYGQDVKGLRTLRPRPQDKQLFVAVGGLDIVWGGKGIFLSEDSGVSFQNKTWDPSITYGDARYGHGVDTTSGPVIYVTGGTWPSASDENQEYDDIVNRCLRLSEHICQPAPVSMTLAQIAKANRGVYSQTKRNQPNAGHRGLITRTFDAGETWDILLDVDDKYFNDINCSDADTCVVVGENSTNAWIYSTHDGGKTWTERVHITSTVIISLFRVRYVPGGNTWYATGGWFDDERQVFEGLIYKSVDNGVTWNIDYAVPEVAILMGLNFSADGTVGYAVGTTPDSQAVVARYDA